MQESGKSEKMINEILPDVTREIKKKRLSEYLKKIKSADTSNPM